MMYQSQAHKIQVDWTPERFAILCREYPADTPISEIAKLTGATEKAVERQVHLRGLKRPGLSKGAWTPERTSALVKMWNEEGKTASQIARAIGNGVTRCGVIAKARRMGLAARKMPKGRPVQSSAVVPLDTCGPKLKKVAKAPLPKPQPTDVARKPMADLENCDCRWPVGDPGRSGFGFCAAERVPGKPYCAEHLQRATAPLPPKKDESAEPAKVRVLEVVA